MELHDIFNICYSVKLAGIENEAQLTRTFLMRTGKRLTAPHIIELYNEVIRAVNTYGYSNAFDFFKDYFPNENFTRIATYKHNLKLKLNISHTHHAQTTESVASSPSQGTTLPKQEEHKHVEIPIEKEEVMSKEVMVKPIKILKEGIPMEGVDYDLSAKDKTRISKFKKLSRKFREMDQKEKEADNRFDYFMFRSKVAEDKQEKNDNRALLTENPFIGHFYNDLDLEFREIMFKIYKHNKSKAKDKSKYNEEIEFLEKYFAKKLHMGKKDEEGVKKLSNAIAYIMKKLQNKIFETDDPQIIEDMLYFKTKLYLFYNYYRK